MTGERSSSLRGESGFTLIEILVAMTLSTIVLLATLNAFDTFARNATRQTRLTDANDQVRTTMDRIVSDLRQAGTIEVADANDLVYRVQDSATAYRRERVCLDASKAIWRSSVTTTTPPAAPIASGTTCPTAGSGAYRISSFASANSASNPLFRYDSATAANVTTVGLTVTLQAVTAGKTDVSRLRASAFVRAKAETALAPRPGDIGTSCSSSGVPTLTLSAGFGPLTVSYTDANGNALGAGAAGSAVVLPSGTSTVVANITSSSGALSQLVKTLAC